jgi:hypothetical protein
MLSPTVPEYSDPRVDHSPHVKRKVLISAIMAQTPQGAESDRADGFGRAKLSFGVRDIFESIFERSALRVTGLSGVQRIADNSADLSAKFSHTLWSVWENIPVSNGAPGVEVFCAALYQKQVVIQNNRVACPDGLVGSYQGKPVLEHKWEIKAFWQRLVSEGGIDVDLSINGLRIPAVLDNGGYVRSPGEMLPVQASAESRPVPRRPCRAASSRRSRTRGQAAAATPLPYREFASPRSARWQEAG